GEFAEALELLDTGPAAASFKAILANRSYALQCLTLWDDAEQAWQQLPREARDEEGKRRQAAAATTGSASSVSSGGTAAIDPSARRRRGEWLLGEWGKQLLQGHSTAAEDLLREAEAIGADIDTHRGDSLLRTSVAVIRNAETSGKRFELDALMRGHAAFHSVRGDAIYAECRPATLRFAMRELTRAGSPFAAFIRLDQAICAYFANEFSRAEATLGELRQDARRRGEPAIEARCEWMLGLIGVVQARFAETNQHYSRAIDLFSRLGEDAHVIYLRSLRARSYEYGGARREAWGERLAALSGRRVIRDPTRLFVIFDEAVSALQDQGYHIAALGFMSEQMRAAQAGARQSGKTDLLVFTLLARAALFSETGRDEAAARDVDAAERAWARLPSFSESRNRLRVEIDLRRTLVDHRQGLERALAAIDRASAFFARTASSLGGQLQILKLEQLRARIESRRGDFRAARTDLLRGAAEVERERLEAATMEDRARILAQAREIFSELMRLDLDDFHDPVAALDALERSSNRVLLDTARDRAGNAIERPALRLEALSRLLPAGAIVVRFGHLADRILLWTLDEGRLSFEQRFLPATELRRQVEQCRNLLARGTAGGEPASLCDTLAQTLLPKHLLNMAAGGPQRLVLFVPDEIVAPLPLGALRIAPDRPYLLRVARVAYAPSLTLLLAGSRALRRDGDPAPHTALFVSDPAFSREIFPSLGRLPAARRAVSGYTSHYPRNEVLTDQAATVPAVLAALNRFELLHFDGHGLTNAQYPERGGLLLAPSDSRRPDLASAMLT
ncbi:MAG TPA: CHAT domain-containing protein, partial [Thermoanaerobaculia bacterium]|nr:CHAT domain-containing protein [Thermoanaerobaculia bacterium]